MTDERKVLENRARRLADRHGLRLQKARRRSEWVDDFGTYAVIDPRTNTVVVPAGSSLDAIVDWLTSPVTDDLWAMWKSLSEEAKGWAMTNPDAELPPWLVEEAAFTPFAPTVQAGRWGDGPWIYHFRPKTQRFIVERDRKRGGRIVVKNVRGTWYLDHGHTNLMITPGDTGQTIDAWLRGHGQHDRRELNFMGDDAFELDWEDRFGPTTGKLVAGWQG